MGVHIIKIRHVLGRDTHDRKMIVQFNLSLKTSTPRLHPSPLEYHTKKAPAITGVPEHPNSLAAVTLDGVPDLSYCSASL